VRPGGGDLFKNRIRFGLFQNKRLCLRKGKKDVYFISYLDTQLESVRSAWDVVIAGNFLTTRRKRKKVT